MIPADPPSDYSLGETRAELPVPEESTEAAGRAPVILNQPLKQPRRSGKEKPAGSKQPAAATAKRLATTVKRKTSLPENAAAMIDGEHEEANMESSSTETAAPLHATAESVKLVTADSGEVAQGAAAGTEPTHKEPAAELAGMAEKLVEAKTVENEITDGHKVADETGPVAVAAVEHKIAAETEPAHQENKPVSASAETTHSTGAATGAKPTEIPKSPAGAADPTIISAYTGTSMARAPEPPRFNIFVIDTGWNPVATKILNDNLPLIRELNPSDCTFLLDRDQSISVLRRHHALIGRDPIISVHDLTVVDKDATQAEGSRKSVHGFRLHLGLVKGEDKIKDALEMFVRFLRRHRASRHLERDVREKLRKEGLAGTIEIMGHGVELFRG